MWSLICEAQLPRQTIALNKDDFRGNPLSVLADPCAIPRRRVFIGAA